MKIKNIKRAIILAMLLVPGAKITLLDAQPIAIDRIVAVVGTNAIFESEIEAQYLQYRMQGMIEGTATEVKCQILESVLLEKLLLHQAELDSIEVTDSEVEQSMDQRLRYFISQFGSQEKLEEFYQKSIVEIKEEFRELIKNQLLEEKVKNSIIEKVQVTPAEVKSYYREMPKDSIPLINSEVEMAQIVKIPPISTEQKVVIKEKLRDLRRRVVNGENFATLAILYSEDPGSAAKGGEIGFYGRGELYPEYEAVAFKLSEGEISEIVETKAGFHIIQLIERKGDYVNTRHILLMTKPSPLDLETARAQLDTVYNMINNGEITFDEAVKKYSDDPGKNSGGLIINPYTGATRWEMDQLEPQLSFAISKLESGQVSRPIPTQTEEGMEAFQLVRLVARTEPHRANLEDDYNVIQEWALQQKQQDALMEWVEKNVQNAYVMIIDDYRICDFINSWFPEVSEQ
jgi:peptidyl-prolyl cis-trans isomerase SurA